MASSSNTSKVQTASQRSQVCPTKPFLTAGRPKSPHLSPKCTFLDYCRDWAATGTRSPITAATQPSVEDVILGAIPGLPKVHLHNPVLAYENGDDFLKYWYLAEQGKLEPFVLVVEGSIPNEKIKKEGYWAALGTDQTPVSPLRLTNGLIVWHRKRWP